MQVSSGVQVYYRGGSSPSPTVSPAGGESRRSVLVSLIVWRSLGLASTDPLAEADHGPHGAAQSAAAAETSEQEPADIDW